MCGADVIDVGRFPNGLGSPPRVRSRLINEMTQQTNPGITSACAEQTDANRLETCRVVDHLRVCGADQIFLIYI